MSLTYGEGLSPADIAACTCNNGNNGSGMWGGDGWWVIVLFLIWGMWGNNFGGGFGGGNGAQAALTRGELCQDMSFQDVKREVQNANDAVNLGFSNLNSTICSQQYDTARMINGVESTVQSGFNATNVAMLQGQNTLATQIAGCCCDAQQTMAGINYNISTQACDTRNTIQTGIRDIIDNQNANARAVLDKLTAQEIEAKNAQISALNQQLFRADLAASQQAQNNYLVNTLRPCPVPSYLTCNPWASQASYGSCTSCGCAA